MPLEPIPDPLPPRSAAEKRASVEARLGLDRREAESASDPDMPTITFLEGTREWFSLALLADTDPDAYYKAIQDRITAWGKSWQILERLNPPQILVCIDPESAFQLYKPKSGEITDTVSLEGVNTQVPGLTILIESPTVPNDFFSAFTITTVKRVDAAPLRQIKDEETARLIGSAAREVQATGEPKAVERLMIVPDDFLLDEKTMPPIVRSFLASKTTAAFADSTQINIYDSFRDGYQESLQKATSLPGRLKLHVIYFMANALLKTAVFLQRKLAQPPELCSKGNLMRWEKSSSGSRIRWYINLDPERP